MEKLIFENNEQNIPVEYSFLPIYIKSCTHNQLSTSIFIFNNLHFTYFYFYLRVIFDNIFCYKSIKISFSFFEARTFIAISVLKTFIYAESKKFCNFKIYTLV